MYSTISPYLPTLPKIPTDAEECKTSLKAGLQMGVGWAKDHPYISAWIGFMALKAVKKKISNRFPGKVVLEINLDKIEITETPKEELLKVLYGKKSSLMSIINLLESAETDKRIKAIVVRTGSESTSRGLEHIQELRTSLTNYHNKSGNPVIFYTNTFGEASLGLLDYWIATACTHIVIPPCGSLNITALQTTAIFCKKMVEKIGLEPILVQRRKHKTMANMWTQEKMTDEHKEQSNQLLAHIAESMKKDIAEFIGKRERSSKATVDEILNDGPYQCDKVVDLGLVTSIMYVDEVYDTLIPSLISEERKSLSYRDFKLYSPHATKLYQPGKNKHTIAYLPLEGPILQGRSKKVYENGGAVIGSDTVCATLREIAKNESVKGLFIRIDSRGGSYIASDLIHNEVLKFKQKTNKPVVVSMSNVAASGGYYIAMAGDKVFANNNTISGSIGVVYGKLVVKDLLTKIGVTTDKISLGSNSGYFSALETPNDDCKQKLEGQTDFIYEDFKKHVSEDTGLSPEEVEEVAQGKVYFGEECLKRKIITNVGGLNEALDEMATQVGGEGRHSLHLSLYPEPFSYKTLLKKDPKNREESDSNPPISVTVVNSLLSFIPGGDFVQRIAASVTQTSDQSLLSTDLPEF